MRALRPTLLAIAFLLGACGNEHRIGEELPDAGHSADARTVRVGNESDGGSNQPAPKDAEASEPSELRNLVATLVEQTVFASGEVDDRYQLSFVLYNGQSQNMVTFDRVVVRADGHDVSFPQQPSCPDSGHGAVFPHSNSPILHLEFLYKAGGGSGELVLTTGCGQVSKASTVNPNIPTAMTLELSGLYEDGAPFTLEATTTSIDGR
ncbi:MAG: hypothetical protein U1E65_15565 [Myxococcota bacterium]